ncbi:lipopolysaccharide biosynthesis protein [Diaminobutyricimonas sp. LJ205]|uniref:lipopolysaccharide biosynthesis protein n=1 Tax=Diaminobutyricimonas sp. LJ205 TaxID=2683590 RepID=UPI0012F51986|nr:oligosaccharide flippase family protein [Diaminobutyricimonas sp. LJ205]
MSAVTGILTARTLGPEDRGTLALAVSVAGLCVLVGAAGTNVSVRRLLPRGAEGVSQRGYERLSLKLLVPLMVILLGALILLAGIIDSEFADPAVAVAFFCFGVSYFLSNQLLDLMNAHGWVSAAARTNALGSIVCMVLVVLATILELGLVAMIYCYAVSVVVQVALAMSAVARTRTPGRTRGGQWALLTNGARLLGLNLGQSLTYRADTILLGALSTPDSVGHYAVATTPAAILRLPANALGQVSMHDVASSAQHVRVTLRRVLILESILIPVAGLGWVAGGWLIPFVYGSEFGTAVDAFRVLLLAELALAPFLVVSRVLAGGGSRLGASVSGTVGAIVLLALCPFLIPPLGASGAAWASVAAYGTMSLASLAFLLSGAHHARNDADRAGRSNRGNSAG